MIPFTSARNQATEASAAARSAGTVSQTASTEPPGRRPPSRPTRRADVIVVGAGPGRLDDGGLPGGGGPRRPAAGEVRVPAREGLRRRADPAGGEGADRARHPDPRGGRLDQEPRPARDRRRRPAAAALARAGVVPRLRPGPAPAGLRRGAGPARGEGRRTAARAHLGDRPGPGRAHRPGRRRHRPTGRRQRPGRRAGAVLPGAGGRRGRRQLQPALAVPRADQARRPADGRGGPDLLHQPAARRRLARVLARAVGHGRQGQGRPAARLRLDLRRRRRHQQRRARRPQHDQPSSARSTTASC